MALGAGRADVLKLVLKQGIVLTVAGVAVGLLTSFGLTRVIATMLFNVAATDKITFGAATLGLFA